MQVNPKLKVLFADDHQFYLDGIQSKFKDDDWFEFVGTANKIVGNKTPLFCFLNTCQ